MYWLDLMLHLCVAGLGYGLGWALIRLPLRMMGVVAVADPGVLLMLSLPLVSVLTVEGITRLWLNTPGAMGMGGLTLFLPMLVSGSLLALAAAVAQRAIGTLDAEFPRHAMNLNTWVTLALGGAVVAVLLWRAWPEPQARLW